MLTLLSACGLAPPCVEPESTGHDPIIEDGFYNLDAPELLGGAGLLVHLLDLAFEPELFRLHGVGTGGYWVFGTDGKGTLDPLGGYAERLTDTYTGLAVLPDAHVAVLTSSGVLVLDVTDPDAIAQVSVIETHDAAAVAAAGAHLVLLRHSGQLQVYELSDPSKPEMAGELRGLESPRALDVSQDGDTVWVADAGLGLVVVDVSDPGQLSIVSTVATRGVAGDVTHAGDQAFVALGSVGVETFALDGPEPQTLGLTEPGGMALQLVASDGLVWVATLEGFATLRQSPDGPAELHGLEPTHRFAMTVAPAPERVGGAYGGAWSDLLILQADGGAQAPQSALSTSALRLAEGTEQAELWVANRGGVELVLEQLGSFGGGVQGTVGADPIPPAGWAQVVLDFAGGFGGDETVCLASNDPGQPIQTIDITTGDDVSALTVGGYAPDFSLPELEGSPWHSLSDFLGRPVLLVWFTTW